MTAFRATLEELADADLLLHVVDAADPNLENKMEAVARVLGELELGAIPKLIVLNKADRVPPEQLAALARRYEGVAVSALHREGLEQLVAAAEEVVRLRLAPKE